MEITIFLLLEKQLHRSRNYLWETKIFMSCTYSCPPLLLSTEKCDAVRPSGFREWPNIRCFCSFWSPCQCPCWKWNQTTSHNNIFKSDDTPNFQRKVMNDQFQKPIPIATFKCYIEDKLNTEHFILMKLSRVALHETQECSSWYYTWPHSLSALDHTSQRHQKWKKCTTPTCPQPRQPDKSPDDNKNIHCFLWSLIGMEKNWHTFPRNRKFTNCSFHVDIKWQESSSRSTEYNRLTSQDQKKYTSRRVLRGDSGAINLIKPVDTAVLSMIPRGDHDLITYLNWPSRTVEPKIVEKQMLFPHTQKSSQYWASYHNTETNPQWVERISGEKKNWTPQTALNQKRISFNDSFEQIRYSPNLTSKQSKLS